MGTHTHTEAHPLEEQFFQTPTCIWHRNSSCESNQSLGHAVALSWNYTRCFRKPRQQGPWWPEAQQRCGESLGWGSSTAPTGRQGSQPHTSGSGARGPSVCRTSTSGSTSQASPKAPAHVWWAMNAEQLALETAMTTAWHKVLWFC